MPNDVHIVFSLPPASVTDDAYSDFYETHIAEILDTPGFVAARRYWLGEAAPDRPPIVFRHLAIYVLDRSGAEAGAQLGRRMDAGELTIPDWFGDVRFHSFDGRPLEDEIELPDHGYMVLSNAPRRFSTEEYYGWYYAHARENLTSDGFEAVRRFALTAARRDPEGPGDATHAAFYTVDGELPELRRALEESARARRVDIPDWMAECGFASYDCRAGAAARAAAVGT